ncbi:hypothetical protein LOC67_13905 [Stieleria sp. JC731]|uniref:hypothetical protein n=1 Tax=Pirellulaceae TaxID=2691357 RepID=UPI001E3A4234|nr:hypothetical protein [Stieleria sp. JC731]MCC9601648.1 hypothetical protein [Stieleria sp. JC731]
MSEGSVGDGRIEFNGPMKMDGRGGIAERQLARIRREMQHVTSRLWSRHFWSFLAVFSIVSICILLMVREVERAGQLPASAIYIAMGMGIALSVLVAWRFASRLTNDGSRIASRIETKFPGLGERLVTASEIQNSNVDRPLVQMLIDQTHDHFRTHDWQSVVPTGSLWAARALGLAAIAGVLSFSVFGDRHDVSLVKLADVQRSDFDAREVIVFPGNTEIEKGSSLVVTAEFANSLPGQTFLTTYGPDMDQGTSHLSRMQMKQTMSDPIVAGFLPSVDQAMRYRIESDDWSSEFYSINVFEFPELRRSDALLTFPEYTGMAERQVEDTYKVTVVEGTKVVWRLVLNKTVPTCSLAIVDSEAVIECTSIDPAAVDDLTLVGDYAIYEATLVAKQSQDFVLNLIDDEGRKNKFPPKLSIKVQPNKPPSLELDQARDITVSALQEIELSAKVRDDYGISKTGLTYQREDNAEVVVELASGIGRNAKQSIEHLLDFEAMEAEVDDLVSFYFWAEDVDADGNLRRTESDLFFAEVRPFEEIYRQGDSSQSEQSSQQQQQQQQGGAAQQAEELIKLQKEIIVAVWNQIRQALGDNDVKEEDIKVIAESQASALEQAGELGQQVSDAKSEAIARRVVEDMQATIDSLTSEASFEERLPAARRNAQSALSGLMKLRAREFEITRGQQQQQSQSGQRAGSARQNQIDELDLDQDESRYETQQQAQAETQQQQEAAEDRQVLSRLRELSRRAEDLMEELAKLQSALEQAEDEKEEEEIQRQLKRLREQQQELLRMSDDLESRMRSEENSERMTEQADQLQQSRESLQQATEATEQNDPSAALASGRRAEQQLEELTEEFRQRSAGAFDQQLRQMRNEANELQAEQERIGQSMRQQVDEASPGLRGDESTDAAPERLEKQAERLNELLEQMQETVEEAGESEPLLAEKLYDGFRELQRAQAEQQLENAAELVRRGFMPQAQQYEREAAESIESLRDTIDEAAGAVLGDSTEGLRRAAQQLEQLREGVQDELLREAGIENPDENQATRSGGQRESAEAGAQQQQGATQENTSGEQQEGQQGASDAESSSQQSPQSGQRPGGGEQQSDEPSGRENGQPSGQANPDGEQQQQGQQQQGQGQQENQQGQQSQSPSGSGGGSGQGEPGQTQQGDPTDNPTERTRPGLRQSDQPGQQSTDQRGQQNAGQQQGGSTPFAADSQTQAGPIGPLTGDFREWSDRMRDVEEMVDDPELRAQATTIRDRVRQMRAEMKRHGEAPQWNLVEDMIAQPLRELEKEVRAELLRRTAGKNELVPIDRDPVPAEFADAVRRYYENLGSARLGQSQTESRE